MRPATKLAIAHSATNVSTLTASIDCVGFNYAQVIIASAAASQGLLTTTALEESDDNTTFTSVPLGITVATTTSANTVVKGVLNVDLRGRKKFLKPTANFAVSGANSIIAVLYNGGDAPVTGTEMNATVVANI